MIVQPQVATHALEHASSIPGRAVDGYATGKLAGAIEKDIEDYAGLLLYVNMLEEGINVRDLPKDIANVDEQIWEAGKAGVAAEFTDMITAVKELAIILERLGVQPGDGIPKRLAKAVVHIQSEKYKGIAEGAWYGKAGGWESAAIGAAVIGSTRRHGAVTETVAHELGRHVASR